MSSLYYCNPDLNRYMSQAQYLNLQLFETLIIHTQNVTRCRVTRSITSSCSSQKNILASLLVIKNQCFRYWDEISDFV